MSILRDVLLEAQLKGIERIIDGTDTVRKELAENDDYAGIAALDSAASHLILAKHNISKVADRLREGYDEQC